MITGLDWMESELDRHKKALEMIEAFEKLEELLAPMAEKITDGEITAEDVKRKMEKTQQDKYKAKMYIAMLEYSIRNHIEFKDYRE